MRFNNYHFLSLCLALLILSSCRFNPNVQGRGSAELQGSWNEEPPAFVDTLLQYSQHSFKFTCDSFYATISTRSKVNYYDDHCFNKGTWKEYAKGVYVVSNDTLYINGTFTQSNFRQKLSGCYRIGQYVPVFLVKKLSAERVELFDLSQNIPVILKLKEKLTCDPKPL